VLAAADAFLFPSLTEGMPNAVLEAMACGLPIVASDIPVLRELSADGERMLPLSGDDATQFADALVRLRSDAALRSRLGTTAATWARTHLDPQATVNAVLDVYRKVLTGGN